MRRVFKSRAFIRWMRKTTLSDANLCDAVVEMTNGLIDAELGGGLVKKRVALAGSGKRSGSRVLLATNKGSKWFFVVGFKKSERDNITNMEFAALRALASDLISLTSHQLDALVAAGTLQEICHEGEG